MDEDWVRRAQNVTAQIPDAASPNSRIGGELWRTEWYRVYVGYKIEFPLFFSGIQFSRAGAN
jgi:hypothetical protein